MPPNAKGGKGYKKKKGGGDSHAAPIQIDRQEGQMIARAIRLLGNRNILCFCNDNKLRICHVCGKMKGRVWIEPGDVVLISLRDFRSLKEETSGLKAPDRGDIVAKYDSELLRQLRKEPGSNPKIFMRLETMEGLTLKEVGVDMADSKKIVDADEDCGFDIEHGSDSEDEDSASGGGSNENKIVNKPAPAAKPAAADSDDEIDVDAI